MYKALYRKYRPNTFDEVVGQDAIIKTLKNALKQNKIAHAYLFTGSRGTGKTSIAKIFAKTINCFDIKDGVVCGECSICKNENIDEIADIIEIDAASNNGVDEIREIRNKVNLVPALCKYKVYIIDEVHMLSIGAFNALLKTLEEPPSHAIFILATTEPQKLPMTIISRCQRFDFKKINIDDSVKKLKYIAKEEKVEIDLDVLEEISKLSDGAMRDAIGLFEQAISYSEKNVTVDDIYELTGNIKNDKILEVVEYIVEENIEELLNITNEFYIKGKNFITLSEYILEVFMNILIFKNAKGYFEKKNLKDKDKIEEISKKIDLDKLLNIVEKLTQTITEMKNNSNNNILFEIFLIKVIKNEFVKEEAKTVTLESKKVCEKTIEMKISEKDNVEIKFDFESERDSLSQYKRALVNNTIANAEKNSLTLLKDCFEKLPTYLIDKEFKDVVPILLDSNISAVSEDHVMLTYKYDSIVMEHDKETEKIKKLINKLTGKNYKIVAVTDSCWNELRPYYVELKKKKKKIEIVEEIEEIKEKNKKDRKKIDSVLENAFDVFGEELIEMKG